MVRKVPNGDGRRVPEGPAVTDHRVRLTAQLAPVFAAFVVSADWGRKLGKRAVWIADVGGRMVSPIALPLGGWGLETAELSGDLAHAVVAPC
jgi:hypothetical protein